MITFSSSTRSRLTALHKASLVATGVMPSSSSSASQDMKTAAELQQEYREAQTTITKKLFKHRSPSSKSKSSSSSNNSKTSTLQKRAASFTVPQSLLTPLKMGFAADRHRWDDQLKTSSSSAASSSSPPQLPTSADSHPYRELSHFSSGNKKRQEQEESQLLATPFSVVPLFALHTTHQRDIVSSWMPQMQFGDDSTSSDFAAVSTITPRHVLSLGPSIHKRKARLLPQWRSGNDNMSFLFGRGALCEKDAVSASSWVVFQGLAVPVPNSLSAAFSEHNNSDSASSSSSSSSTPLKFWSKRLRSAFNLAPSSPGAVTPELLPALWWFYVWLHRNHTFPLLFDGRQLEALSKLSPPTTSKEHSSSDSGDEAATRVIEGPYKMILRSAREADKLGQMKQQKELDEAVARRVKRLKSSSSNQQQQLLTSLTDQVRSAHAYALWRLERDFTALRATQLHGLVRHFRVFLEYVDIATVNDANLLKEAKKPPPLHRERGALAHCSAVLPLDHYTHELRVWREWRLLFAFFPVLAVRAAQNSYLRVKSATTSSVDDGSSTSSVRPMPLSSSVRVLLTQTNESVLESLIASPDLTSDVKNPTVTASHKSSSNNVLLLHHLPLSDYEVKVIRNRTGAWVFRAALPALDPRRHWRHLTVAGDTAASLWDNLIFGWQRTLFDTTNDISRSSGERKKEPFFVFAREMMWKLLSRKFKEERDSGRLFGPRHDPKKLPKSVGAAMVFVRGEWQKMSPVEQSRYLDQETIKTVFPDFAGFKHEDLRQAKKDELMFFAPQAVADYEMAMQMQQQQLRKSGGGGDIDADEDELDFDDGGDDGDAEEASAVRMHLRGSYNQF